MHFVKFVGQRLAKSGGKASERNWFRAVDLLEAVISGFRLLMCISVICVWSDLPWHPCTGDCPHMHDDRITELRICQDSVRSDDVLSHDPGRAFVHGECAAECGSLP